ncbi:recombinase family protein [Leptothrix discophora]|uniref:Recombinase family protein n=1 Tax=Leptothrix discophora TaxID=89 RepID=A0ABT9G669_LEPDI|nr:recombinase family protein [Leptothrix discophora]MDP4301977.1 recombinase family protein [Leptothrix discophora]
MNTPTPRFVAYVRVSTQQQGASGLGMEAQQAAIAQHVNRCGGELAGEFVEVESGRKTDKQRPQLAAALVLAKKAKATLVIAKLDRLARNVHFISGLMEAGVQFVALDMPEANKLTLHVMAAFAEHEREAISKRTQDALMAAKSRGVELGTKGGKNIKAVNDARKAEGQVRAEAMRGDLAACDGLSLRAAAASLAAKGHKTESGSEFSPTQVQRLRKRLGRADPDVPQRT